MVYTGTVWYLRFPKYTKYTKVCKVKVLLSRRVLYTVQYSMTGDGGHEQYAYILAS